MHYYGRFEEHALVAHPIFEAHSDRYRAASLIDRGKGSVHTGLSINELAAGGRIDPHGGNSRFQGRLNH